MYPGRRSFIQGSSLALLAQLGTPTRAIEPIPRKGRQRIHLSLAAYSFRNQLPNYRGGKGPGDAPMDMLGFIDYAATLDLDAVELTSYFIPDPCPPGLAREIKRRCHVAGLDISGGAIGNNFAYGPGDERDRQMATPSAGSGPTRKWVPRSSGYSQATPRGKGPITKRRSTTSSETWKRPAESRESTG